MLPKGFTPSARVHCALGAHVAVAQETLWADVSPAFSGTYWKRRLPTAHSVGYSTALRHSRRPLLHTWLSKHRKIVYEPKTEDADPPPVHDHLSPDQNPMAADYPPRPPPPKAVTDVLESGRFPTCRGRHRRSSTGAVAGNGGAGQRRRRHQQVAQTLGSKEATKFRNGERSRGRRKRPGHAARGWRGGRQRWRRAAVRRATARGVAASGGGSAGDRGCAQVWRRRRRRRPRQQVGYPPGAREEAAMGTTASGGGGGLRRARRARRRRKACRAAVGEAGGGGGVGRRRWR